MNTEKRKLWAEFAPDTRFEVSPASNAPFRAVQENEFERLKIRLLKERLAGSWSGNTHSLLRRAANEAAAVAWLTGYPLLVFPALFEEKAEAALEFSVRQKHVRRRSQESFAA